jgi:tetratricopeptide (TPR) repeat protein
MRRSFLAAALVALVAVPAVADWQAGVDAYKNKDWGTALKEFQGVVQQSPNYAGAHYMLGLTLKQLGRSDDALKEFREADRLEPANPAYAVVLASMLMDRNRPQDVLSILNDVKVASLKGAQKAAVLSLQARAKADNGDFNGAIELARQATQADARSADAWATLGTAYSRQDRSADAFGAFRKAWEIAPEEAFARNAIATGTRAARLARGDQKTTLYTQVADVAKQLAQKKGGREGALSAGEALMGAQQFDDALTWLNKTGLDNALVTYYKGQCYLGKQDWGRSEQYLRQALQKSPDAKLRKQIYASLGFLLDKNGQYTRAAEAYQEAGETAKVAEMHDKEAKAAHNREADAEAKRIEELKRLQEQYNKLTKGGGAPTPPPPKRQ